MIVGIDIGASTTKGVVLEHSRVVHTHSVQTSDATTASSKVLKHLVAKAQSTQGGVIEGVAVSGGGSRKIGETLSSFPVTRVDEIKAIGLGGLLLAEKQEALILSVGTGTAMVAAYDEGRRIVHAGGTGVGGGTILGLSKIMLGIDDFKVLERMVSQGDTNKVDLTVSDIVGGPIGIVPGEATASNFGRLNNEASKEDLAAGIFSMTAQVVGVLAVMAARAYGFEKSTVFVGRPMKSKTFSEIVRGTTLLFGVQACIPENCEYCTAVGTARSLYSIL